MKIIGYVAALAVLCASPADAVAASAPASSPASSERVELLSIRNVRLAANEYIDSFEIKTQGVEILAACRVPYGWHVSLGDYDSVEGDLKGEAGLGVSFINKDDLSRLNGLFLVRVRDFTDKWDGTLPPTYRLSVVIGRYGDSEGKDRRQNLPLKNLKRVPARACPPPGP